MTLGRRGRRLALFAHVTISVGWLGAVGSSLALALVGLVSDDPKTVRGAYLSLRSVGWYVLVPFSLGSLLTGLVSSLGTVWGLLRHYWVVAKLMINLLATFVLIMYMQTLDHLARLAVPSSSSADLLGLRSPSPVLHAGAALLLLVLATGLGLYKPRGMTPYGWRKTRQAGIASNSR